MAYQSYDDMLKEKRAWYKAARKSYCPILNDNIFFTSKGFNHLLNDGTGKPRSKKERKYRMGLLPLAIPVLKTADKILKYEKRYSKRVGKIVEYWRLVSNVGRRNTETTVILRRIGTGKITFYSIWKKSR